MTGPRRRQGRGAPEPVRDLSLARLALASMGAASVVLVAATVLILVLRPGAVVGLVIGVAGLVGAVAALGIVSTRMTRRAYGPGHTRPNGPGERDDTPRPDDQGS